MASPERNQEKSKWPLAVSAGIMAVSVFGAIKEKQWPCVILGIGLTVLCLTYTRSGEQPQTRDQGSPPEEDL